MPNSDPVNILLVDDRLDGLFTLEAVLKCPRYNLIKASSGREALAAILQFDFAVILLDVQMPGMDGFETASLIKEREKSRHIPIIFVTAINEDPFLLHKGYEVGAVDYLFKPFDPRVLKSKVGVFTDLHCKNRMLKEQTRLLQHSEESKRVIIESARDVIATTDMNGMITSLNPSFEAITGWKTHEWIGKRLETLIREEDRSRFLDFFGSALQGQNVLFETSAVSGTQTPVYVEVSAKPLIQEWAPIGVIAVMRDISARIDAERERRHREELERSNKELDQFASICSHDLQEPLRVIRSYASLLKRRFDSTEDEDSKEAVKSIIEGASRMSNLVRDILAFSQIGGTGLVIAATQSEAALDRAINNLQKAITESEATITRAAPLPSVMANELQLLQVFQNLISNSIKFRSEAPPCIHVSYEESKKEWIFCIRDNGIGFEMRHAQRVFEVFNRLHRNDQYPGTGVGLGICKQIIERHGGRIWAESETGKGSTFRFSLPKAPSAGLFSAEPGGSTKPNPSAERPGGVAHRPFLSSASSEAYGAGRLVPH